MQPDYPCTLSFQHRHGKWILRKDDFNKASGNTHTTTYVIQFVQVLSGMLTPVWRYKLKFSDPLIGQTTKFCWPAATIVSPLMVQSIVIAVSFSVSGFQSVVGVISTLRKSAAPVPFAI